MKQQSTIDFPAILRTAGLRVTPGRLCILGALARESQPVTVEQLGARIGQALNHVTLYRALEAFTEAGIVSRVDLGHEHAHFELIPGRPHHHHAVCTDCGYVEDVIMPHAPSPESIAARRAKGFARINRHALEFFGQCRACA